MNLGDSLLLPFFSNQIAFGNNVDIYLNGLVRVYERNIFSIVIIILTDFLPIQYSLVD